jgi:hypothetical protein
MILPFLVVVRGSAAGFDSTSLADTKRSSRHGSSGLGGEKTMGL